MHFGGHRNYQSMNLIFTTKEGGELWLGDYYAATNQSLLKQKNIKAVLTCAAMLNVCYPKEANISHKVINAFDVPSYKMTPHFEEAFKFIEENLNRGHVLVHCAAGISRSTTCVLVYLMRAESFTFLEGLEYVRKKRSIVCPNYGFQNELKRYESILLKKRPQTKERPMSKEVDNEKKIVIDFLSGDDKKRTMQSEQKFSVTMGNKGVKKNEELITNQNKGASLTMNNIRGRSLIYNKRQPMAQINPLAASMANNSKLTNQFLMFRLETPKIVTIKK